MVAAVGPLNSTLSMIFDHPAGTKTAQRTILVSRGTR